jgi:FMN phosphatase YigB (HAD superfamily)
LSPLSPKSPTSPGLSCTTTISQARYGDPDQSLIFLDWDDTLFPSTEVFNRWGIPSRPHLWGDVEFSPEQEAALTARRAALFEHLCTAASLSERVVIVTNSRHPWVSECAAHFAPNILPLLAKMRVAQLWLYFVFPVVSGGGGAESHLT